jgi:uncharacterized membrane protein
MTWYDMTWMWCDMMVGMAAAERKKAEIEMEADDVEDVDLSVATSATPSADTPDTEPADVEAGPTTAAKKPAGAASSKKEAAARKKKELERLAREQKNLEDQHDKERADEDRMMSSSTQRSDGEVNEFADEFPTFREPKQM